MMKLIYVMDPQCGWCYGNSNNIQKLVEAFPELDFEIMVGGMWVGDQAPKGGDDMFAYLQKHAPGMEQKTGALLSTEFYELSKDETYTMSSFEACLAIKIVKNIAPEKALKFASELQRAQFYFGQRFDDFKTYLAVLQNLNIDPQPFMDQFGSEENQKETIDEINESRKMAAGFPSLFLDTGMTVEKMAAGYFEADEMIEQVRSYIV
ncbi:DsbA family protein [Flammeovirga sp. MY04]|uniref:DsbA family protein n=1 Tax=Flammeovirga sp. MY04 TaxID=1191459 RepID=UPI000825D039|nr:DsbA family protein [Flammeovirga sp. MY04]ANQ49248.2 DsbA family protein [Flammeovirga sp. MY04]